MTATAEYEATEVVRAIRSGAFDPADLAAIDSAVRTRRKIEIERKVQDLGIAPGDTVKFSTAIRPKYLIGATAEVVKVNQKSVTVKCPDDPAYGRFQGKRSVRCPNGLIEELA